MVYLYHVLFYRPLLNVLVFFYQTIAFHDLGVAIILLTVFIRLLLFPVFHKSVRHQMVMQRLQPELKKIQERHKENREEQTRAMMALYKEHNINPFSGILLLVVQLPILIALYQIFLRSLNTNVLSELYPFVIAPHEITTSFLGLINLRNQSILLVGLAALAQYFQGKLSLPQRGHGAAPEQAERLNRWMTTVGPLLTILIFYRFPGAVSLYWATTSLFSIVQQLLVSRELSWRSGNNSQKN